jgi:hypothetical protein
MSCNKTKIISIDLNYFANNSEPCDPMFSANNYMPFGGNCDFIRDKFLCEKTKHAIARVYTQDMKNKFQMHTEKNSDTINILNDIKRYNPKHKFTFDVICPPNLTLSDSFERLKQNALFILSEAINVSIFGGTVLSESNNGNYMPFYSKTNEELVNFFDIHIFEDFLIKHNLNLKTIVYSHFGFNEQYKEFKNNVINTSDIMKIKCFNRNGQYYKMNDNRTINYLNLIEDETRPIYNLKFIEKYIKNITLYNKDIKYIEFNIRYEYSIELLKEMSVIFRKNSWHMEYYINKLVFFNLYLDILN